MSWCKQKIFKHLLRLVHKTKSRNVIYRTCSGTYSESNGNGDQNDGGITETSEKLVPKVTTSQPGFLESWYYGVDKFGTLNIDVPFSLHIKSLDSQKYPDMNKFFVKLVYDVDPTSIDNDHPHIMSNLTKLYRFDIDKQDDKVSIDGKFVSAVVFPVLCTIEMPMKFDVNINCSGETTLIENLENDRLQINSSSKECVLNNIKSGQVDVFSQGGDVICQKVIQGNLNITVEGRGSIKTDRLQGLDVNCSTDSGDISSTSIYADQSFFTSNTGNLKLANCHGKTNIKIQKGNLVIDSLDGSMDAQLGNGNTDVYVTKADQITINASEGSIRLKVPDTLQSSFELVGESVFVDSKLPFQTDTRVECDGQTSVHGHMNSRDGSVIATTMKGDVALEAQDWLTSLKLRVVN